MSVALTVLRGAVRSLVTAECPSVVCLQETKLSVILIIKKARPVGE
jgi:hypothetical protein